MSFLVIESIFQCYEFFLVFLEFCGDAVLNFSVEVRVRLRWL